jgi:hypothetical protein
MVVPEIDIPVMFPFCLSEIGRKQSGSTLYVGRRSEFMIRHSTLRIQTYQLLGEILKCVRCLPVTTFILAETKITVKSGMQSYHSTI